MEQSFARCPVAYSWRVADCLELWRLNNLFKIFLLSFTVAFLASIFLLRQTAIFQYLLVALVAGVTIYVVLGVTTLLKRKSLAAPEQREKRGIPKKTVLGILVIILLFAAAFVIVRNLTTPTPGYQLVTSSIFVLPDSTALTMRPLSPNNECAWLESMDVTTRQKATSLGLPDCDYAWPHVNLSQSTLFLEFENFTEFAYTLNNTSTSAHGSGTAILCFTIPNQSFQCWVPPAKVSHLR